MSYSKQKTPVYFGSWPAAFIVFAVFTAIFGGCTTVVHDRDTSRRDMEVIVEDLETARAASEIRNDGDDKLHLQYQYEQALQLYERGEVHAAGLLMTAMKSEAQALGIPLPEGFEEFFQQIMTSEATSEPDGAPAAGEEAFFREFEDELTEIIDGRSAPEDKEGLPEVQTPPETGTGRLPDERTPDPTGAGVGPEDSLVQPEFKLPGLLDPELADEKIILDFNQVDIRIVLETISDITGANFLVDRGVSGAVTLISSSEVRLSEVFRVLESILDIHGWVAVPSEDIIKILPRADAVRRHIPTRIGTDPAQIPRHDGFATQVMRLNHLQVQEAAQLIQPRISPGGSLIAHEPTNTVFITDVSSNIHQIAVMLNQIDRPREETEMSIFPLKYASSRAVAEKIQALVETRAARTPVWQNELRIIPDTRTNSLIVFAVRDIAESVGRLVENLDIPRPEESVNIHVVKLFNADAQEMVDSLSATIEALTAHDEAEPIHITADVQTNSLIIASSPQDFQVLRTVIDDLDVMREQVLVELRIMEASQFALEEIGFDWATMDPPSEDSIRGLAGTDLGPRRGFMMEPFGFGDGGITAALVKGERVGAVMRALQRNRHVNVLSTPHILTSNHQTASIAVVENVPYVRESRIVMEQDRDVIRTFDYRDVGIQLNITPHIGAGGMVRMVIGSEFSKVIEESEGQLRTSKREADTTVSVESGETVVIGGLIQDDTVKLTRKVPLLGSIPVLGHLFRYEREDVEKTNLLIFITPHVLSTTQELAEMTAGKEAEKERTE